MFHDTKLDDALWSGPGKNLTLAEPDDLSDEAGSWWRDVAAGSAFAIFAVAAALMFLR